MNKKHINLKDEKIKLQNQESIKKLFLDKCIFRDISLNEEARRIIKENLIEYDSN